MLPNRSMTASMSAWFIVPAHTRTSSCPTGWHHCRVPAHQTLGDDSTDQGWRALTERERLLLNALVAQDFFGAPEIRTQIAVSMATQGCECGCGTIALRVDHNGATAVPEPAANPLPGEAHVLDDQGEIIGGLIAFHQDGWLTALEIYTWGDEPLPLPDIDRIRPFVRETP